MAGIQKKWALLVCAVLLMMTMSALAEGSDDADFLILAGEGYALSEDYVPDNLIKLTTRRNDNKGNNTNGGVYTASNTSIQLVETAANALVEMINDAEADGIILYVRQGYRSYADEAKRYERMKDTGNAQRPGESDYQTGLGVTLVGYDWRAQTLTTDFAETAEAKWMSENCARYGFIIRYPAGKEEITGWEWEPWHLRYVGKEAASAMALSNMCLEEYLDSLGLLPERVIITPTPSPTPWIYVPYPTPEFVPDGAQVLEETGEDGDYEITLFQ